MTGLNLVGYLVIMKYKFWSILQQNINGYSSRVHTTYVFVVVFCVCFFHDLIRPIKINGSPVSLTENAAVFRKTEF